jgi:hypothetical protein
MADDPTVQGSQGRPENQGTRSPDATARPPEPIPVNRRLDSRGAGDTEPHTGPAQDEPAE